MSADEADLMRCLCDTVCYIQAGFCVANSGPYTSTKPPNAAIQARLANSTSVIDPLKAATILVIAAVKTAA